MDPARKPGCETLGLQVEHANEMNEGGKLNICIIASARYPIREPFAGGLEAHTHALATSLKERGHRVVVYASGGVAGVERMDTDLDLSEAARSDPSMPEESFLREHHAYLRLMLHLADADFDLIQNSSLHYLPVAMAPAQKSPLVTTLHTPPTPWLESALRCQQSVGTYVSVSRHNARSWSGIARVHEVIPNGIDLRRWRYSAAGDPGRAVWTGRIVPEKGTHLAVRAAHAAGLRISLAGPVGDPDYFENEVLPRLAPGDEWLGHLRQEQLASLVGSAGVVLGTPRWEEPYGLVVAEALACGTPVVAFDRGAVGEILTEETGRLAPPDDAEALGTEALQALELDRAACRERAEAHCSLKAMVDRYEALYRGLAA